MKAGQEGGGSDGVRGDRGAVVRAPWVAVRAEPDHRSELTSQWLCGETLVVVDRQGDWIRTRGPDGYEGWCSRGGLLSCDPATTRRWREAATARSLGVRLGAERSESMTGTWLPFGARVVQEPGDVLRLPLQVRIPDPGDGRIVEEDERRDRFPSDGGAVSRTASRWRGTPYLWGGRTRHGADCSGFVQAVFALHGVALPRDSGQQQEATPAVKEAVDDPAERRPGDLLFFRSETGDAVSHVALSLGGTKIVHAADARGGVAADDLAGPPPELTELDHRLVAVTRPLQDRGSDDT